MAASNVAAFLAFQRPPAGKPSDTLPAWQIVRPLPAEQLLAYYHEAEAATGVPWYYLASINLIETRMGRIHGLSTAGARRTHAVPAVDVGRMLHRRHRRRTRRDHRCCDLPEDVGRAR